ncbi:MAG TPA: alpha/beta hydrolase-fold protein [Solirubrobacter sp.]|nr:alpha/beta hydrolase-fold protein [Solirubrobacter sp.]
MIRAVEGPAGAPWERPLHGTLDRLVIESDALAHNPLNDPEIRPLYVYRPPGVELDHPKPLASVYVIQGFTGQLDMWLARQAFEPTMIERLDAMFTAGECPDAIVVFVDAWTSYGGSQFLNSTSTGRYLDYLCDEVVAFVDATYPTAPAREHRAIAGKSSGGYGAMVVPMLRPDVFGALASHAGDALFEACYAPGFPRAARRLRDEFDGSWDAFFERATDPPKHEWIELLEVYGYAACYSPDPATPGRALVPFDGNGRRVDDVWDQWLAHDPVRMAPHHADALRSLRRVYLDAGRGDEYYLDLGAQAFATELAKLGVDYTLELFDGTHARLTYRYPGAIRELVLAIAP